MKISLICTLPVYLGRPSQMLCDNTTLGTMQANTAHFIWCTSESSSELPWENSVFTAAYSASNHTLKPVQVTTLFFLFPFLDGGTIPAARCDAMRRSNIYKMGFNSSMYV